MSTVTLIAPEAQHPACALCFTLLVFSCRHIMAQLAVDAKWPVGWAYDGAANMFAPRMFLPQHESEFTVRAMPATRATQYSCVRFRHDRILGTAFGHCPICSQSVFDTGLANTLYPWAKGPFCANSVWPRQEEKFSEKFRHTGAGQC